MNQKKIVNIDKYSDNIIVPINNEVLDTNSFKNNENINSLFNNKSIKGDSMSEFITKETFNQFEKRVDQNLSILETKIDNIPSQIEDKLKVMLMEQSNEQRKERKEDRKTIITWIFTATGVSITGTSLIIGIATFILKFFNIL
ncbi:hypothetical protein [Macrococcoides caseolyticum]|uniref:hypothetical protein n=1 Tax=Macrococcoides caseolyticum TaxID=69966 RepID=UPI000C32E796|nr:hypothetical protein [Macrococcus caseolyticus]PKE63962.1 hypothetical protein CW683_03220 [Macrococcus caseolyticus]